MDIYLIKDGVVENIAVFESVAQAQQFYPEHTCIERTETNAHINPGEAYV